MIYDSLLDLVGNTPLVGLPHLAPEGVRLYAKLEGMNPTGSVKDRIAKAMIESAEKDGILTPDRILLEPSSGNTGIAMAMICRVKGYRLAIVMPESVSPERRRLLEAYGAEVFLSPGAEQTNGAIRMAQAMTAQDASYLMLNQYENPANPAAHEHGTAAEIIRDLPEIDMFVAGLGTGGTIVGCGRRLKAHNPSITIVAAEPPAGELVQGLRSLADGYIPPVIEQGSGVIDRKFIVGSLDSFFMTRELLRREGLFAGISSGNALHAALRAIKSLRPRNVVVLLPDAGWKYLSSRVHIDEPEQVEAGLEGQIWW